MIFSNSSFLLNSCFRSCCCLLIAIILFFFFVRSLLCVSLMLLSMSMLSPAKKQPIGGVTLCSMLAVPAPFSQNSMERETKFKCLFRFCNQHHRHRRFFLSSQKCDFFFVFKKWLYSCSFVNADALLISFVHFTHKNNFTCFFAHQFLCESNSKTYIRRTIHPKTIQSFNYIALFAVFI